DLEGLLHLFQCPQHAQVAGVGARASVDLGETVDLEHRRPFFAEAGLTIAALPYAAQAQRWVSLTGTDGGEPGLCQSEQLPSVPVAWRMAGTECLHARARRARDA